jgi:hypothetical protein
LMKTNQTQFPPPESLFSTFYPKLLCDKTVKIVRCARKKSPRAMRAIPKIPRALRARSKKNPRATRAEKASPKPRTPPGWHCLWLVSNFLSLHRHWGTVTRARARADWRDREDEKEGTTLRCVLGVRADKGLSKCWRHVEVLALCHSGDVCARHPRAPTLHPHQCTGHSAAVVVPTEAHRSSVPRAPVVPTFA